MTKYQYSGLTPELHQRLVSEHAALKEAHPRDYKQHFQDVKQCDELYNDLQDYLENHYTRGTVTRPIVDTSNAGLPEELFKQFQGEVEELRNLHKNSMAKYIMEVKGCDRKEANRIKDSINCCYVECIVLTPLKVIQMEGLLSRDLFSKIAKYVLNNYEWPEKLDDEVDRIVLKYRTKGELGRKKPSVKRALYTALAMGL